MIAAFARRRTPAQRIALLVLVVMLADFSIPAGCDCGDFRQRASAPAVTSVQP